MANKFDVVIIGSGLSGLICSNILSKKGYNVAVVEKQKIPGGCLQTFKHNGITFDTGIHYIGSFDEGQKLYKFYKYLGVLPGVKLKKLDVNGFDRFKIGEDNFAYANGYENFTETLCEKFPQERDAITNFAHRIKKISDSVALYNFERNDMIEKSFFEKIYHGNTNVFIQSLTKNIKLQNVLAALNILYAGKQNSSFLFIHSLIYNHYIESAYRIVGGSHQFADKLIKNLESNGGKLFTNEDALKFNFNNNTIKSLNTSSGNCFYANHFISSIHPQNTMRMLEPGKVRKSYYKRISGIKNTTSSFAVYLVLKENTVPYINYNQYVFPSGDVWLDTFYSSSNWPGGFAMYPVTDSMDQKFLKGMMILTMMDFKEFEKWKDTKVGRRGKEYNEFKEAKAGMLINSVSKHYPDIAKNIKSFNISTPLTYRDYTGTPEGSIYGIERDFDKPLESFIFPKTRIPNLLLTGQSTGLHGMLGVSIGSLLTCAELTDLNQILVEINNE